MTGDEVKAIRHALGDALGRRLSIEAMARLVGLSGKNARDSYMKWEKDGPSGPGAELLQFYAIASGIGVPAQSIVDAAREALDNYRNTLDAAPTNVAARAIIQDILLAAARAELN